MRENFKENLKPVIFIAIVLFLTAVSAYPQRAFGGKVVKVIDGKTCVIEMSNRRVTAVLQYIEIPEPDQPLHSKVKEHLEALILDKTVEFQPRGVKQDKAIGKLFVKGIDVSQQMLRDGAAWYSVPEKNGQSEAESLLYQDNETQAKAEKRGVWNVENLKPAWEYRAEKEALQRQQDAETLAKIRLAREEKKQKIVQRQKPASQVEMWADVGGANGFDQPLGYGGLRAGYNPTLKIGHVSTPSIYLDFPNSGFLQKVDSRLFYLYKGDKTNIEDSIYMVGFVITSKESKFTKLNNLTIGADSQKLSLGKAQRFFRQDLSSVKELLLYKITRAQLMKIVNAQKISVQIGNDKGVISNESLTMINNLLNAS